jgi:phospholipid-binding lipoprotein MlaA
MKPGAYFFIPFVGPSSPRDGIGFLADYQLDILTHYNRSKYRDKLRIIKIIHQRASLLDFEDTLAEQEDEYVFVRNAWMQNRNFRVRDGEIAEDDVDDSEFGDEFD